jgi:transposase
MKETFGDKLVIGWGMGTQNSYHLPIAGSPPSPQRKLRDFLAHFFPIVGINEYMTTQTCCHCRNKTEAFVGNDGKGVHGLRVCRNGKANERIVGYLHRDINAAVNIRHRLLQQCGLTESSSS